MAKQGKSMVSPRLRFPEFRGAPAWTEARLEDLITVIAPPAKLQSTSYLSSGKFPIVDQSQQSISGWTDDATAVVMEPLPLIVFGDHTCALKLLQQPFAQGADGIKILKAKVGISTEYLFHSLSHRPLGMVNYKRHFSMLKERPVSHPDIKTGEQQKIADCLSSLDEVIAAQGRKMETLATYKRGLMQRLFPREGETIPRLRFPEFRDAPEWREWKVGDLIETVPPPKKLPTTSYRRSGTYPIVDQSPNDYCGWTDDAEALVAADHPVIVFGDHTCTVKLLREPFAQGADGIKILDPRPCVLGEFLFQTLQLRPLVSNEYRRHFSELREKRVYAPPRESGEQERVSVTLGTLDAQIVAETKKLDVLKTHKGGLMQQLFPVPEEV